MAKFSKRIVSRYNVESYQGTKKAYEWICNALETLDKRKIIAYFEFRVGDVECTCQSIDELIEIAYGEKDYKLTGFYLNLYLEDGNDISFVCVKKRLTIEAKSKAILENIVELLLKYKNNSINSNVSIHNNYNIGSINGDNNSIIQGNNNNVNLYEDKKKPFEFVVFLKSIFENIFELFK